MSSDIRAGDKVRVIDATFMPTINVGDVVEVDHTTDKFVYLVGYHGGWDIARFEVVKPEPPTYAIGLLSSDGKEVVLLRENKTFSDRKEAADAALERAKITRGTRAVVVLKVVHEFRPKVEIEEVNYGG